MPIIALGGKAKSGKDTMADILVKRHGFAKIALADPLREICSEVFKMPYNMFLDQDKKDAPMDKIELDFHDIDKIRHYVTEKWGYEVNEEAREDMENYHGKVFKTPRDILRCVGTNLLRDHVSQELWLELAVSRIKDAGGKVVVSDCRFENERDFFRKCGALLVLIKRNDNGNSEEHEFNLGSEDEYDVVFDNSGTLQEYQGNVDLWYTMRKNELELYKVFKYE
jgi:hypothetical protein